MFVRGMSACMLREIGEIGDTIALHGCKGLIRAFILDSCIMYGQVYRRPLYRFYIFSGVEKTTDNDNTCFTGYASRLARYIRRHRLGKVWKSGIESNHSWHPNHLDQVFIWSPDHDNLGKWWEKHKNVTSSGGN